MIFLGDPLLSILNVSGILKAFHYYSLYYVLMTLTFSLKYLNEHAIQALNKELIHIEIWLSLNKIKININ